MLIDRSLDNSNGSSTYQSSLSIMPTVPDVGTYEAPDYIAPDYDESKVRSLQQQEASGAIRGLRSAMQKVSSGSYDNPNVKRMTLREALAGYGQGLQSAMSSAGTSARNLYNTEYGMKADAAKTNYAANVNEAQTNYQAKYNAAMAGYQAKLASYMQSMYGNKSSSSSGSQAYRPTTVTSQTETPSSSTTDMSYYGTRITPSTTGVNDGTWSDGSPYTTGSYGDYELPEEYYG